MDKIFETVKNSLARGEPGIGKLNRGSVQEEVGSAVQIKKSAESFPGQGKFGNLGIFIVEKQEKHGKNLQL